MAKIGTGTVLNGITNRPIIYEIGSQVATRRLITDRKVGSAISPTPQQTKPIPSQPRKVGGRTF